MPIDAQKALPKIVTLPPVALEGTLDAISSKSDLHRLILCAALSPKPTRIRYHAALSADIRATIEVLRALGAEIFEEPSGSSDAGMITVTRPLDAETAGRATVLDCNESGSTARFILPLAALYGKDVTITGSGKLPERPFEDLCVTLEQMGARFSSHSLPIRVEQTMKPHGYFEICGNVSSQYITGLLFILPLCKGAGIRLTTPLASAGYVELTADALRCYGVAVEWKEDYLRVTGSYRSPLAVIDAQGDWSNAAFWLAAANGNHKITLHGLGLSSQPDRAVLTLLSKMGMHIETHGDTVSAYAPERTHGISFDASGIPDLVPILSIRAAVSKGKTVISGTHRLRLKESDRVEAVCRMISDLGGTATADEDHIYIEGQERLRGGSVDSFNDHRIAMSAAIAAVFCENPVTVTGADAVAKSYPQFFEDFKMLVRKDVSPKAEENA